MDENATARLREEHTLILQVVDVLKRLVERLDAPAETDFGAFEDCITFIRLFTDGCHHGKEEDVLFPALEAQGLPRETGPIAVMLQEHEQGRYYTGRMNAALEAARAGDDAALEQLRDAARGYVALMQGHILKEDNVLFDMADRMVRGPSCRDVCWEYDSVCAGNFEGRTKARLEELATDLVRRVPED